MEPIVNKHKHHFELLILLVIFIVFFGIGLFLLTQKNEKSNNADTSKSAMEDATEEEKMTEEAPRDPNAPDMMLKTDDGANQYETGENFTVVLAGDSKGADVNGFDVLVDYDTNNVEMVETKPANKAFQVFTFPNTGYLSVTAAKLLESKEASAFSGNNILLMTFKAKKAGVYTFKIEKQKGNERTKFVDSQANIHIPNTDSIDIDVR